MVFSQAVLPVWPTHSQPTNQPTEKLWSPQRTNHHTKKRQRSLLEKLPVNIFPFWAFPYRNTICKLAEWIAAAPPRRRRSFPFSLTDAQRVLEAHHVCLLFWGRLPRRVATISLGPFSELSESNCRKNEVNLNRARKRTNMKISTSLKCFFFFSCLYFTLQPCNWLQMEKSSRRMDESTGKYLLVEISFIEWCSINWIWNRPDRAILSHVDFR